MKSQPAQYNAALICVNSNAKLPWKRPKFNLFLSSYFHLLFPIVQQIQMMFVANIGKLMKTYTKLYASASRA